MEFFWRKYNGLKERLAAGRKERQAYADKFRINLRKELSSIMPVASFVSIFAWLNFALDVDPRLHPDFPELVYFRFGLTGFALVVFAASFIKPLKERADIFLQLLLGYALFSCALFTGRIAHDPNYVSGFQIMIFITTLGPFTRRVIFSYLLISIVLFTGSAVYFNAGLTPEEMQQMKSGFEYSMNNLAIVYVMAAILGLLVNRFRFNLFVRHHEVQLLKERQDGDYFLTSALINPLSNPDFESELIKVESFLDQYKKFSFRKWSSEIGGDYCSSSEVELKGRKYAVFINADAMGKSIQGAGGSLVLGTVFKTVVARNRNTESDKDQFPERWLKRLFIELQDVFISFEGSMLISAVMGLVDLENGMVYFINSEHPFVALFRDGKAEFIEDELQLRKIGIEGQDNLLTIQTFEMQPGDKLFLGSDGRDDLILGEDKAGARIINEDETLFLRVLEEVQGNVHNLKNALTQRGSLSDDLSLMSIELKRNVPSAEIDPGLAAEIEKKLSAARGKDDLVALLPYSKSLGKDRQLARRFYSLLVKNRLVGEALELCEAYVTANPADTEFLYFTGYMAKLRFSQSRQRATLRMAADYAERCRLRDRGHVKNLVNLANIHALLGNRARSKKIVSEIEKIDPGNEKLSLLNDNLDQ